MKKIIFAILLSLMLTTSALAEALKAPEKALLCTACHGANGISTVPEWPSIAGQHQKYLLKELHDIKEGKTRQALTMSAILNDLSDAELESLAAFYASQPAPQGTTPENYLKRGELLYRGGDRAQGITACIACHGPNGRGNGQAGFPLLSGQHAEYTIQQLKAFKSKERTNDLNSIMRDISSRMNEDDMRAVAYYIQGLH